MTRFIRYDLRTTDVDRARRFYDEALGIDFADAVGLVVGPLPEPARARGAPSHWLGRLGVDDLDATLARFLEAGAERLGPSITSADGASWTALRDPFGAVVALGTGANGMVTRPPVRWHHLHTKDLDGAWSFYARTFGWTETGTMPSADVEGGYRTFAWADGGEPIGTMANTARLPGVHTHWLHSFGVADLDATAAKIVAAGGEVFRRAEANGMRLAGCHDPQGAAFGIVSR